MEWPVRSLLFIPAHKVSWAAKAGQYRPGAVVLDVEDAVPPHLKAEARAGVPAVIKQLQGEGIGGIVRINALEEGGVDDLGAIVSPGLDAVMLPKARTVAQIRELDDLLSFNEGRAGLPRRTVGILILPETSEGIQDARELAAGSPRVRGIVSGVLGSGAAGDFAQALGIWPTESGLEQNYVISKLSLDSRAAGAKFPIGVVNGVKIDQLEKVRELTLKAKLFGYTGVVVIHPSHLEIVNEIFTPTQREVDFYEGIIAKMKEAEAAGSGAVRFEGEMIDYAMIARAKQVLEDAKRLGIRPE
jgi:citrate lyase subunit beta/citryl-CoA lyase